jgi:hypothetical protein
MLIDTKDDIEQYYDSNYFGRLEMQNTAVNLKDLEADEISR